MTKETVANGEALDSEARGLQPLLTGKWDESQTWAFYKTSKRPDSALCTAVFCLAILPDTEQVVLTRNHRGWEMLGEIPRAITEISDDYTLSLRNYKTRGSAEIVLYARS